MPNRLYQELARTMRAITISGALTQWDPVKMRFLQTTFMQYNIFNENDRICITISLNLSPGVLLTTCQNWFDSGLVPFRQHITRSHWIKALCLIYTVYSLSVSTKLSTKEKLLLCICCCICLNAYYDFHIWDEKGHLYRQPLEQNSHDTSFSCLVFFVPPLFYLWF